MKGEAEKGYFMERSQQNFLEDHSECQCRLGLRVDHGAEDSVQERRRMNDLSSQ